MTHLRAWLVVGAVTLALTASLFLGAQPNASGQGAAVSSCPACAAKSNGSCTTTGCCASCTSSKAKCGTKCNAKEAGTSEACEASTKADCCSTCAKAGKKNCCCKTCASETCCKDCAACAKTCAQVSVRVYQVGDLLGRADHPAANELQSAIVNAIATETWHCQGGKEGNIEYLSGTRSLVIRQSACVHEQVAQLLLHLRAAAKENSEAPQVVGFRMVLPEPMSVPVSVGALPAPACANGMCMAYTAAPVPCVPPPPAGINGSIFVASPMPVTTCLPPTPCGAQQVSAPCATISGPCCGSSCASGQTTAGNFTYGYDALGRIHTSALPAQPTSTTPVHCAACQHSQQRYRMTVGIVCEQTASGKCQQHLVVDHPDCCSLQCDKFTVQIPGGKDIKVSLAGKLPQEGVVQAMAENGPPRIQLSGAGMKATADRICQLDSQWLMLCGNVVVKEHHKSGDQVFTGNSIVVGFNDGKLKVHPIGEKTSSSQPTPAWDSPGCDPLAYLAWYALFGSW